jgi:hypothetical protein
MTPADETERPVKPLRDQIDEIMDHFDFTAVMAAMRALDWTWAADADGTVKDSYRMERPTESDVRRHARQLLNQVAAKHGDYALRCGGLCVRKEGGVLCLSFEVATWTAD